MRCKWTTSVDLEKVNIQGGITEAYMRLHDNSKIAWVYTKFIHEYDEAFFPIVFP